MHISAYTSIKHTPLKGEPFKAQRFKYGKRHKKCSNCPRSIVESNHMQNDVVILTVTCSCLIFRLSLVVGACPAIPQKVTGLVLTFPLSWHFCCFLQWPRMSLVLNVLFLLLFCFVFLAFLLVAWFLLVFLSVSSNFKQKESVYMPRVRRGSCLLRRRSKCLYWNCKFQRSSCGKERG